MSARYLFGPVTSTFAAQYLAGARDAGECLAFGPAPGCDLIVGPLDAWDDIARRLPAGWEPDFVVLYLPYTQISTALWNAPVPLVGLAPDWNLLWHLYRLVLPRLDLVFTDSPGVEAFKEEGIEHVRAAVLFRLGREHSEYEGLGQKRDIDVLFVGNLHPAVQRERTAWLERLTRLGYRWNVRVDTGTFGASYRELLGRSRIVFNRSIRGEANQRVFEAAAAGALLFQEAGNRETPSFFTDRREYVEYTDQDLEELLEYYLENEGERQEIAGRARAKVGEFGFERFWGEAVEEIQREVSGRGFFQKREVKAASKGTDTISEYRNGVSPLVWQALSGPADAGLVGELAGVLARVPRSAFLHNALGVGVALASKAGPTSAEAASEAAGYFRRAVEHEPADVLARLNLVEALGIAGQRGLALEEARKALTILERSSDLGPSARDGAHYPPGFDYFRVEWERAAWSNAGDERGEMEAKRAIIRWRLHSVCAAVGGQGTGVREASGEGREVRGENVEEGLAHAYEAVVARGDLGPSRLALGRALARAGQSALAVPHLRRAVDSNPFDLQAARALFKALGDAEDPVGQREVADQRRLLAKAAPKLVPEEAWMVKVPPPEDGLVSIVILCRDQIEYTRLCLESVFRNTRAPYELILVDNGSTDGTTEYLEGRELRGEGPGPSGHEGWSAPRVVVLHNKENCGFAAGCNQGLARARGRYLVFLNNDTVVTAEWLERLVRWSLHDWPKVGVVGPMSNYAPPPQLTAPGYRELSDLPAFAWRHHRAFAGKALAVERLTGFCLLVLREVLNRVGGFDERFGVGFFEDDDLCVRAREAGFGLLLAQDVYIHHFGSRTIRTLDIDPQRQLAENLARFREKWGEERSAGYRMPAAGEAPASKVSEGSGEVEARLLQEAGLLEGDKEPEGDRPHFGVPKWGQSPVSLCMIVKNEEANLSECLASVADLVDEIVVVDTGSTDRTREVAERFGARVAEFAWCDSFAEARNESLRLARGEWVFWMDADDRIDEENRRRLRELFRAVAGSKGTDTISEYRNGVSPLVTGYSMKCRCLPEPDTGVATVVDHVRLFRNLPGIRWKYRVHEQILPAIKEQRGTIRGTDIVIQHAGYLDGEVRKRKTERDLRLLLLDHADNPDDPFILFNLGWNYSARGEAADALPYLRRSLELSHPSDSIVRKLYLLILGCHRHLGQAAEALALCRRGLEVCPDDGELLMAEAELLNAQGDLSGAERRLQDLLEGSRGSRGEQTRFRSAPRGQPPFRSTEKVSVPGTEMVSVPVSVPGPRFASVSEGLRGYRARHMLAIIYRDQGRMPEAEAQWREVVAEQPLFRAGWEGLGELYLAQRRWNELEEMLRRWEAADCPDSRERGKDGFSAWPNEALLRARLHMAREDFSAARAVLESALEHHPEHAELWNALSYALLREGKDLDRAERALRFVLAKDGGNRHARNNLAVLLRTRSEK